MCADLAQQHALEDLHNMTEHSSEQHESMNNSMGPVSPLVSLPSTGTRLRVMLMRSDLTEMAVSGSSHRSSDRGTQYDEPPKPEE